MPHRALGRLVGSIGSIAVVAAVWPSPRAAPHPSASGASCAWSVVPSPNIGTGDNQLNGVDGVASDDVWAVGSPGLTEHWDGATWSIVPFPTSDGLSGVAAIASDDVWAVGGSITAHWDGAEWTIVPNPGAGSLAGVTAVASDDVWAAGQTGFQGLTLTEHWDGTSWRVVHSPNRGPLWSVLSDISAASATDVWAVGNYYDAQSEAIEALGEHWDGARWSLVRMPDGGPYVPLQGSSLYAVRAVSADDVWAVGTHMNYVTNQYGFIDHWDGRRWRTLHTDLVGTDSDLFGVDGLPGRHAWAVGESWVNFGYGTDNLIYRLERDGWVVDAPPAGVDLEQLYDVATIDPTDVWSVGFDLDDQSPYRRTLVEHCG